MVEDFHKCAWMASCTHLFTLFLHSYNNLKIRQIYDIGAFLTTFSVILSNFYVFLKDLIDLYRHRHFFTFFD